MKLARISAVFLALFAGAGFSFAQPATQNSNVVQTNLTAPSPAGVAAVINGETITMNDLQKVLEARPPSPVPLSQEQQREMKKAAMALLINDTLMRQYLTRSVPQVSQDMLKKEYAELADQLSKQKTTIEQMLQKSGTTQDQLQREIVTRIQWRQLLNGQLPEEKAKEYYQANKLFFDKVFVKASHILIKVDAKATPEKKAQAKAQIDAMRAKLVAEKIDFALAAKSWSECPSKDKGGDIGPFPFKFVVVDPFARAAFSLKVGEVSPVVETEFGYHIIQCTERTPGEPSRYEDVREAVREVWAQDVDLHGRILQAMHKDSKIQVNVQ